MRIRISNENEFAGRVVGSAFWYGRAWLWSSRASCNEIASAEWQFLHKARSSFGAYIQFGSGDAYRDLGLHVCIPWLFSVFLTICDVFPKSWCRYPSPTRKTGFYWHDGSLWIQVLAKEDYERKDPWYAKMIVWHIGEWTLGRPKYTEAVQDSGWKDIQIGFPEGVYDCKIRLFTSEWKRRFNTKRLQRAEIKCEKGVPEPGKGESSWDCGDDATFGLTCPARNEWDAIGKFVASVMRQRFLYGGGTKWRASEKAAT